MRIPRVVVAGTHSGCGKTTVASGIMAALTARGMKVQPFKVGPDFIDPSHHTKVCGRPSRNLDPFMMGESGCFTTFLVASRGADIAVIEGVMGVFDGVDGSDLASTAHVARILDAPVLLVIDAKGMSRSIHALIKGFMEYDPTIKIAGVIINRIGSTRHKEMIASSLATPALGWISRSENIVVKSRHLGLFMAHESDTTQTTGSLIEESCNLDEITAIAQSAPPLCTNPESAPHAPDRARIGVAMDNAFCFYYQNNLDRLRKAGSELIFFSPIQDSLPEVDGVYLGGGYPELHLPLLESSPCTKELKKAAESGIPIYAECGGLMYLTREIQAEKTYRMAGILPADAEMTGRIQALGYVKGDIATDRSVFSIHQEVVGHEFHYSRVLPDRDVQYAYRLTRGKGIDAGQDGMFSSRVLGCYTHAYFSGTFADELVGAACRNSRS
ncbi:cobyrinate a,c-diamide synthase [uncultured Methanoregula sp.]|uniref:cobyrinate a,c-diamide synthase n=1 Tax=uncultured Methanoregula sp. TaxID=1005933 RepID=UPI002AAC0118|nr:cobyrinate a,c-diamide synthase [uncultured Methanoregula sp.]